MHGKIGSFDGSTNNGIMLKKKVGSNINNKTNAQNNEVNSIQNNET